jgi:hypothetical protein
MALPLNIPPVALDEPIAISLSSKESASSEVLSALVFLFAWAKMVVLSTLVFLFAWAELVVLSALVLSALVFLFAWAELVVLSGCFDVATSSFGARRARELRERVGVGGKDTDADRSRSGGAIVISLRSRARSVLQTSN